MHGFENGAQNGNKLGKIYNNTIVALKDYNERKYVGLVETPKNERKIKRVADFRDHLKVAFIQKVRFVFQISKSKKKYSKLLS